jgi:hypothetical protein
MQEIEIEIEIETAQKTNMFGRSYYETDWDVTSVGRAPPAICCRCVILAFHQDQGNHQKARKAVDRHLSIQWNQKATGNDVFTMLG